MIDLNSTIKSLLNRTATTSKHYSRISEITGDNYNIFKILKVDTSEVRLHSAFLANLLNRKGSHGQGSVFLSLFIDTFGIINFEVSDAITKIEEYAGKKTEEDGGRIDIIISSKKEGRNIIIENKIYAPDQENQLLRYSKYPNLNLFYLTLYGVEASEKSIGKKGDIKYTPISYSVDIINWLERCKKETVSQPILRETITQYINLIRSLTNQSTNQQMKEDILDIVMESSTNITGFFELTKVSESVYKKLLKKLEDDIKSIALEENLECWIYLSRDKKYSNFGFYKKEWNNVTINFEWGDKQTKNLYYGFKNKKEVRDEFSNKVHQKFITKYGNRALGNDVWLCYTFWDEYEYRNWDSHAYLKIYEGEMKNIIKSKVQELILLTDSES